MVYFLFFLSGISGLIYQVVWVRQFGNLFGNTIYSAALITSVFMLGLGLGSYFCGGWADRLVQKARSGPLRLYGVFEFVIAVMGLVLALMLPELEWLSAEISSYVVDERGWFFPSAFSLVSRYVLAFIMLAPITFLMGGTLTLLIRYVSAQNVKDVGYNAGMLYGINTAGAAIGCLLVDLVLIPNIGIFSSELLAVLFNVFAGLGAINLAKEGREPLNLGEPLTSAKKNIIRPRTYLVLGAVFLAGFLGMSLEIVWFRFLSSQLGAFRSIFSLLLAAILVGMWLGSMLGGIITRKTDGVAKAFCICQAGLLVVSALLLYFYNFPQGGLLMSLGSILFVVFIPALFMGCTFPLANGILQESQHTIGKKSGVIYLVNTVGATSGSLFTGFLLLPILGMQGAIMAGIVLAMLAVGLILLHIYSTRNNEGNLVPATSLICLALAAISWMQLDSDFLIQRLFSRKSDENRFITMKEHINDTVAAGEDFKLGFRNLYVDGKLMSGTYSGPERYMRAFSHIPLMHIQEPKKALVICFGVGNTLHAVSLHPSIDEMHVADLSENVLNHAHYFENWNGAVLKDKRTKVFVNDGRQHMRTQDDGFYDLISLEPPPISTAGMASLYSKEFYEIAHQKLSDGGFITQWLPIYQVNGGVAAAMVKAFIEVFPNTIMVAGYRRHFILMGRKNSEVKLTLRDFEQRLSERPKVHADLKRILLDSPIEFFGSFAADADTLREATQFDYPLTDDFPIIEYTRMASEDYDFRIPKELFKPRSVVHWCSDCGENGKQVPLLSEYLFIMADWYKSDNFAIHSNQRRSPDYALRVKDPTGNISKVLQESQYLKFLFSSK